MTISNYTINDTWATGSPVTSTSGSVGTSGINPNTNTGTPAYCPKQSKQELRCFKCNILIAKIYAFPITQDIKCISCYQVERLKE